MSNEYGYEVSDGDINITDAANERIAKLFNDIDDDSIEAVRLYVSGGGCGGMNYGMTFTECKTKYDKVLKRDDYLLYVDAVALNYLRGVEIDYATSDMYPTFVFNNVFQATGGVGTCGACGAVGGGCG